MTFHISWHFIPYIMVIGYTTNCNHVKYNNLAIQIKNWVRIPFLLLSPHSASAKIALMAAVAARSLGF